MTRYDLHIHTVLSDGQLSPYSIIEKAKREGLGTISITDHETIIHFKEFKGFADNCGIELIPGIEINVGGYYNYHFLGYGIQDFDKLEKYLLELKKANEIVCLKTLDLLKEKFSISFSAEDLIKKHSKTGVLDKKVIVKELIASGYARGTKEAYDLYIGRDAPAYCPIKKISDEQVIKLIHDCGGICVWAHPTLAKYKIGEAEHDFDRAKCQEIPAHVHPHLWRHTRAMHLYQHGMDLTLVSQWLGHTNIETTLIYAHADTEHKRHAITPALGDSAAPGVVPEKYTVSDEEMLQRLYGL